MQAHASRPKRRPNSKVNQRVPASGEQVGRKANSSKIARKPGGHGDRLGRRVEHKDGQAPQKTSTRRT